MKIFGKLPLLEWVSVQGSALHSFLEALVFKTEAAENLKTAYCNVSFPKLRYILLENTDFFATRPIDILLDYLKERCERNAEIQTLRLNNCTNISFDDVERLKEFVVDVIWNVEERDSSEEDLEGDDGEGNDDLGDDDSDVHRTHSSSEEMLW